MQDLPLALRRYLYFVWAVALTISLACFYFYPPRASEFTSIAVFAFFSIIAVINPINYSKNYAQTVDTALLVASSFLFFPSSVILVVLACFSVYALYRKLPLYKGLFNISFGVILFGSIPLLTHTFGIQGIILSNTPQSIVAVGLIFLLYTVFSTSLMALVVALANQQKVSSVWRDIVKFFNAYDIALLPYGLMLAWLWQEGPWHFVVGLLPLVALQRSFAHHAGLLNEQKRTAELVEQQRRVHEAMTVLLSGKTMDQQLNTLLQHIHAVFPVSRAGVVLWGQYTQPDAFMARDDTAMEHLLQTWRDDLHSLRNTQQMVRLDQACPNCRIDELPLWLVPLTTPDGPLGSLVVVGDCAWKLSPQQQRLMETFASQAALAISQSRLIARLQETRQQLIESERLAAIGGLAAGVAHEFNNLLSVLSGNVQVAMDEPDPEERQHLLSTVVRLALNGTSITEGLLRFGRREVPKREQTNLASLVDAVLTAVRNDCKNAKVTLVRDFDDVPPVVCEAGAISQVLINLLYNALDAIHPNAGTITVRLKLCGSYAAIAVQDTGCGIPADLLHTIFEPFMTTKSARRDTLHGGTGLGLSVSHGIIANHGGYIDVDSEVGVGSTFTIYLPMTSVAAVSADEPAPVHYPLPRLHAVVVDDEPAVAQMLGRMLSRDGHVAEWYTRPEEAIAAIRRAPVDVVFADLRMPGMDGLALLDWVQQQVPSVGRILMSAHIDPVYRQRAREHGITAIIEKPFEFADVRRVLGTITAQVV